MVKNDTISGFKANAGVGNLMIYDFIGAIASLLSTYLFIRLKASAWLVGLFAIVVNTWLYWHKAIYADMCLEAFYFLSTCYGLYLWTKGTKPTHSILQKLSKPVWLALLFTTTLLCIGIYLLLSSKTNSTVPILDAFTTALSLLAQLLLCYKVLATWIFWFIADACYAAMYYQKNLPFHAALMIIYTGMAVAGYITWKKKCSRLVPQGLTNEALT